MRFEFPDLNHPKKDRIEGVSEPRLRSLLSTLELLSPNEGQTPWKDLYKDIGEGHEGLEVADRIRDLTYNYIAQKIPVLQEKIPQFKDISEKQLCEAIVHNWFEEVSNLEGTRTELLLTVAASVVKRIETFTYKQYIQAASVEDLKRLGLSEETRTLAVDLLDITQKTNPLYIRYAAYAGFSEKPGSDATTTGMMVPGGEVSMTAAALFPHETQFIGGRLRILSENSQAWESIPGAHIFKEYLICLSNFYKEADPLRAKEFAIKGEELFLELTQNKFPIYIIHTTEGSLKEPYIDPELRLGLWSEDMKIEEGIFKRARDPMADSLGVIGADQFSEELRKRPVRSLLAIGNFGAGLTSNAVAQEDPVSLIYLNDQIRTYDREFYKFGQFVLDAENKEMFPAAGLLAERISRMCTVLHENGHALFPNSSSEASRMGLKARGVIDEVKAEVVYRALVPELIERGGVEGSHKEWAMGMLGRVLQQLRDQPEGDFYFYDATYILNCLIESGAVTFREDKLYIENTELYYETLKIAAREVLKLYEDQSMNDRKAQLWIQKRCKANAVVTQVTKFIKEVKI